MKKNLAPEAALQLLKKHLPGAILLTWVARSSHMHVSLHFGRGVHVAGSITSVAGQAGIMANVPPRYTERIGDAIQAAISGESGRIVLQEEDEPETLLPNGQRLPEAVVEMLVTIEPVFEDDLALGGSSKVIEWESNHAPRDLIDRLQDDGWTVVTQVSFPEMGEISSWDEHSLLAKDKAAMRVHLSLGDYSDDDFDGYAEVWLFPSVGRKKIKSLAEEIRVLHIDKVVEVAAGLAPVLETELIPALRKEITQPGLPLWRQDGVQFPRLLSELRTIGLTPEQYRHLEEVTDLHQQEIDELFERAEKSWQALKAAA